jgi:hypothetical protein
MTTADEEYRTPAAAIAAMPEVYASMPRLAQRALVTRLHMSGCGRNSWRRLLGLSDRQAVALIDELGLPRTVRRER